MRGLYIVPALSVIVVFFAAAALGRRMGHRTGMWTAWVTVIATPVVVYGLELWEHAPAAACVIVAAALLAPPADLPGRADLPAKAGSHRSPWLPPSGGRLPWRAIGAGAAIMAGTLFREEVAAALPALAIARALSVERDRMKELAATGLWMAVGATAVFLASVPMNLLIMARRCRCT